MLGSRKSAKESHPPESNMRIVSLREGIKKLVSEMHEEAFANLKKETLETIRQAMEAHRHEIEEKLETHFEEFDERNILEEIRKIKGRLAKAPAVEQTATDEEFRANLIKSVDETVREKMQELEQARQTIAGAAAVNEPKADMKGISEMIIKQFESLRNANQQEFNSIRGQMALLKQKFAQLEELENRIHELESLIQKKLAEPVIIE